MSDWRHVHKCHTTVIIFKDNRTGPSYEIHETNMEKWFPFLELKNSKLLNGLGIQYPYVNMMILTFFFYFV